MNELLLLGLTKYFDDVSDRDGVLSNFLVVCQTFDDKIFGWDVRGDAAAVPSDPSGRNPKQGGVLGRALVLSRPRSRCDFPGKLRSRVHLLGLGHLATEFSDVFALQTYRNALKLKYHLANKNEEMPL